MAFEFFKFGKEKESGLNEQLSLVKKKIVQTKENIASLQQWVQTDSHPDDARRLDQLEEQLHELEEERVILEEQIER